MMDMVSSISEMKAAETSMKIGTAVAKKVMDTTASLQEDMMNQLLAASGIGQNLNTVA
jgi:hypothetical protein